MSTQDLTPYKALFAEGWMPEFCIGAGWNSLVIKAIEAMKAAAEKHPDSAFELHQVKEKFGGLRIYYGSYGPDEYLMALDKAIKAAVTEAAQTCEVCGKPGTLRHGSWLRTLCDEHDMDRQRMQKGGAA